MIPNHRLCCYLIFLLWIFRISNTTKYQYHGIDFLKFLYKIYHNETMITKNPNIIKVGDRSIDLIKRLGQGAYGSVYLIKDNNQLKK